MGARSAAGIVTPPSASPRRRCGGPPQL